MRNYKQKLLDIENAFDKLEQQDWMSCVTVIQELVNENPLNMDVYIRIIYILHHILVEEKYTKEEGEILEVLLKKYFTDSYPHFKEEPEYLFFVGKILYIAEWYFGINDDNKPIENRLAFKMQKKAFEKEPTNKLYKWGYLFSKKEKEEASIIVLEIISENNVWINWLDKKGFPGKYIITSINNTIEL